MLIEDLSSLNLGASVLNDVNRLLQTELVEMEKRKIRKILEQKFELETLGKKFCLYKKIIDTDKEKIKLKHAEQNNNRYIWICINPKPGIKLENFRKRVEKLVSRAFVKDYLYVYEQRGTTLKEAGKGFHTHILLERKMGYKPSKIISLCKNTCKSLVGNIDDKHLFRCLPIGTEYALDKKQYILSWKQDKDDEIEKSKRQKQQLDAVWRPENCIQRYLGNKDIVKKWDDEIIPNS